MFRRAALLLTAAFVIASIATVGFRQWNTAPSSSAASALTPDVHISTEQFAKYVNDWSEPEGFFDSDNFISNETSYLHITDQLKKKVKPAGVYLGVGPDQNFSYIAQTQPSLAIIIDIRRQNLLEHLLYKALFELSNSRVEFLSMLFSRSTPEVEPTADLPSILMAVRSSSTSRELYEANLIAITNQLIGKDGLALSAEDQMKIAYVYTTFWRENLDLRFSSIGRGNASQYPTYEDLLLETDRRGMLQNYLANEASFQWMRRFEIENRLLPVVGDFAGKHAFATVSAFLREQGLAVSTFYTSNVEFYLFDTPAWTAYMDNVRAIPTSPDSVFIRAYFPTYGRTHPENVRGHRSTTLVHDMQPFIADYAAGKIPTYWEVVNR